MEKHAMNRVFQPRVNIKNSVTMQTMTSPLPPAASDKIKKASARTIKRYL